MDKELSGIGIKNFRIFHNQTDFKFSPITILTGPNNSGKSSLLKGLLLLEEYFRSNNSLISETIDFSATLPLLGTFDSLVNDPENREIVFSLPFRSGTDLLFNNNPNFTFELTFTEGKSQNKEIGTLKRIKIFQPQTGIVFLEIEYSDLPHIMADDQFPYPGKKTIVKSNLATLMQKILEALPIHDNEVTEPEEGFTYQLPAISLPTSDDGKSGSSASEGYVTPSHDFISNSFTLNVQQSMEPLQIALFNEDTPDLLSWLTIKVRKLNRLLFKYKFRASDKSCMKIALDIEKKAIKTVSEGQCSFTGASEFLKYLEDSDIFFDAVYKNNPAPSSKTCRGYSFADKQHPERVEYNFFILLFHEVLFQLFSSNLSDKITIDYDYYNKMQDIDPDYLYIDLIDEEIPILEQVGIFYNECLVKIIEHFKQNIQFEYLTSARTRVRRVLHKEIEKNQFYDLIQEYHGQTWENSPEYLFTKYWLKEFDLGDDLIIERNEGTISTIYLMKDNKKRNIADFGTGVSQFIPILLTVVLNARRKNRISDINKNIFPSSTLIIEEPESNFHPKSQSKLADFFIDASSKFNFKFIIETHSEYLIRKFQYWVARKTIRSIDVSIYYFHENSVRLKTEKRLSHIEILNDGILSEDFGSGFFDEALHWKFELLKLKNLN
jgi:predicted ATPase